MKRSIQLVVFGIVLGVCGRAQNVPPGPSSNERQELFILELVNRQMEEQRRRQEVESAERREEQFQQHQFLERANAFVQMWSAFAKEYNERKTFNVKTAEKITRAFHQLETSKDWPRLPAK
jgi:hypothetical protein